MVVNLLGTLAPSVLKNKTTPVENLNAQRYPGCYNTTIVCRQRAENNPLVAYVALKNMNTCCSLLSKAYTYA